MNRTSTAVVAPQGKGFETVRVITETLRLVTDKRLELYNLTEKVALVKAALAGASVQSTGAFGADHSGLAEVASKVRMLWSALSGGTVSLW